VKVVVVKDTKAKTEIIISHGGKTVRKELKKPVEEVVFEHSRT